MRLGEGGVLWFLGEGRIIFVLFISDAASWFFSVLPFLQTFVIWTALLFPLLPARSQIDQLLHLTDPHSGCKLCIGQLAQFLRREAQKGRVRVLQTMSPHEFIILGGPPFTEPLDLQVELPDLRIKVSNSFVELASVRQHVT